MTERERLIELLDSGCYEAISKCKGEDSNKKLCEFLADYLLDNGVIVPPVPIKAGKTVYDDYLNEYYVEKLEIYEDAIIFYCKMEDIDYTDVFRLSDIGNTVFLSREAAEKALAERKKQPNCNTCSYVETTKRGWYCCYFNGATQNENDWCYHYKEREENA